jgi:hypothetical protein
VQPPARDMAADPEAGIAAAKRCASSVTRGALKYVKSLPREEGDWVLSAEHGRIMARAEDCNVVVMLPPCDVAKPETKDDV